MPFRYVELYKTRKLNLHNYPSLFFCRIHLQLDSKTVWLRQEFGKRCYFPDHNGYFNFDCDVGQCVYLLVVEGAPPHHTHSQSVPVASSFANPEPANITNDPGPSSRPFYKPILAAKKEHVFNVKVIKATMNQLSNGKVEFDRLEQTFVSIDESSANINTITNAVQKKWGATTLL